MKHTLLTILVLISVSNLQAEKSTQSPSSVSVSSKNFSLKATIVNLKIITKVSENSKSALTFTEKGNPTITMYPHFSIIYYEDGHEIVKNNIIEAKSLKLSNIVIGDLVGDLNYGKN